MYPPEFKGKTNIHQVERGWKIKKSRLTFLRSSMLFSRASITTLRLTDQSQTWRNNWLYLYLFDYFRLQALSLKDGPSARQCSRRTLWLSVAGRELGTKGRRLTASALSKSIASYGRTRPLYKRRGDWNRRTFSIGPHVWHVLHELLTAKWAGLEKWKLKVHKKGGFL